MTMTQIRLYGCVQDSIVDGPGLRYAIFVQGCTHGCPGCHNPESQPASGGQVHDLEEVLADVRANPLVSGVTLSGGEPFEQAHACAQLAAALDGERYDIWTYTGYLLEDLLASEDADVRTLLEHTHVLVDGPFVEAKKSLDLKWCGSSNQRLIDMPKTLAQESVILWQPETVHIERPSRW